MPPLRALIENDTVDNGRIHVHLKLPLALKGRSSAVLLQPATARANTGVSAASSITFAGFMESIFQFTRVQFLHGFLSHSLEVFSSGWLHHLLK